MITSSPPVPDELTIGEAEIGDLFLQDLKAPSQSDKERVERLIDIYRLLGSGPTRLVEDQEAMSAVLLALEENRDRDAAELLEIMLEEPETEVDQDDNPAQSPVPGAQIWRLSGRRRAVSLALVGGTPSEQMKLHPSKSIACSDHDDWVVEAGDLVLDVSQRAAIDLSPKGELYFCLLSGDLIVESDQGAEICKFGCAAGAPAIARIPYVRSSDSSTDTVVVRATEQVRGVWWHSRLAEKEFVFSQETPEVIGGFSPRLYIEGCGELEKCDPEYYTHEESERVGDFERWLLPICGVEAQECLGGIPDANPIYIKAAPAAISSPVRVHKKHSGVELLVALEGVVWVSVDPKKTPSTDVDRARALASVTSADGSHVTTYVTPLVSTIDGARDVMLLDSSYGHCAWIEPGSSSRCLQVTLGYPKLIEAMAHRQTVAGRAASPARSHKTGSNGR